MKFEYQVILQLKRVATKTNGKQLTSVLTEVLMYKSKNADQASKMHKYLKDKK